MKIWNYDELAESEPDGNSRWVSLEDYSELKTDLQGIYELASKIPAIDVSRTLYEFIKHIDTVMKTHTYGF